MLKIFQDDNDAGHLSTNMFDYLDEAYTELANELGLKPRQASSSKKAGKKKSTNRKDDDNHRPIIYPRRELQRIFDKRKVTTTKKNENIASSNKSSSKPGRHRNVKPSTTTTTTTKKVITQQQLQPTANQKRPVVAASTSTLAQMGRSPSFVDQNTKLSASIAQIKKQPPLTQQYNPTQPQSSQRVSVPSFSTSQQQNRNIRPTTQPSSVFQQVTPAGTLGQQQIAANIPVTAAPQFQQFISEAAFNDLVEYFRQYQMLSSSGGSFPHFQTSHNTLQHVPVTSQSFQPIESAQPTSNNNAKLLSSNNNYVGSTSASMPTVYVPYSQPPPHNTQQQQQQQRVENLASSSIPVQSSYRQQNVVPQQFFQQPSQTSSNSIPLFHQQLNDQSGLSGVRDLSMYSSTNNFNFQDSQQRSRTANTISHSLQTKPVNQGQINFANYQGAVFRKPNVEFSNYVPSNWPQQRGTGNSLDWPDPSTFSK